MKKRIDVSIASDYAVLGIVVGEDSYSFYYGYEAVDANDNWCFRVTKNGKTVETISGFKKDLPIEENLLIGIGLFFAGVFNKESEAKE